MKTKFATTMIAILCTLVLAGCGPTGSEVPDLANTDEKSASTFLLNQDLLPEIVYEFNPTIESGLVVKTEPQAGDVLAPGSKVKVYVSKGPSRIDATDSNIEWYSVGYSTDDWNYSALYIEDGVLTVEAFDVKFGTALEWRTGGTGDLGFGRAAINDKFIKSVPISFEFEKKKVSGGEKQDIKIFVPTSDLDNDKPTTIYLELYAKVGGRDTDVKINFTITW